MRVACHFLIEGTDTLSSRTALDEAEFRSALSRFATGVAVVTVQDRRHNRCAITINSFTSVSLDPPLVLFCLGKSAFNFDAFAEAGAFAVNVLSWEQRALSDRFAREAEDHFPDLVSRHLRTGSPILSGCLAALDCMTEARHEAGDHLIIVGQVVAVRMRDDIPSRPLLYFGSSYRDLKLHDDG